MPNQKVINDEKSITPLMTATIGNDVVVMRRLLEEKPGANMWDRRQDPDLVSAAPDMNHDVVSSLFTDFKATRVSENAAMDYAAALNKLDALKLLIAKDTLKNKAYLDHALLLAATYGQEQAVALLIQAGANIKHEHLLTCALANKGELPEEKHIEFVKKLIHAGMDTKRWLLSETPKPAMQFLYIQHAVSGKTLQELAIPVYEAYMNMMEAWIENKSLSENNRDKCAALVARISYAHEQYDENKDEMDLRRACQFWSEVKDIKRVDDVDAKLIADNFKAPPLWLRGSLFRKMSETIIIPDDKMIDRSKVYIAKLNTLIQNTLDYLAVRYRETGTKCYGYSAEDYVERREITDELTGLKIKYEQSGEVIHLQDMKTTIADALKKPEIKGRHFFSSHRFADHLNEVLKELDILISQSIVQANSHVR